jgi:hypothetical protein
VTDAPLLDDDGFVVEETGVRQSPHADHLAYSESERDRPCLEYRGSRLPKGYGRLRRKLLHRMIVEMVEGRPLAAGEVVMHLCDNPACFRYAHLRRATQGDNIRDAVAKGRHKFGTTRYRLTPDIAEEIRRRHQAGETPTALGSEFGVAPCHITNIAKGRKWT